MSRIYVETSIASFYFEVRKEPTHGFSEKLDETMVRRSNQGT
jgi:hypothetical protein